MAEPKVQLSSLTGMRFFLALWVVAFHQPFFRGFGWMASFPTPLPSLFHTGYMAVGVFFVLSGFVLSYNYPLDVRWSRVDLKRFAVARFARIYPAYCIGMVLSAPWVAQTLVRHFSRIKACEELVKAALAWTLFQAWFPQTASAWNSPGWSLSVETFFYACFAFLGMAIWRLSRLKSLAAAAAVIWAASLVAPLVAACIPLRDDGGLPGMLWSRSSSGDWVEFVKFNPVLHIPQFCMGIVVGKVYHLIRDNKPALVGRGHWLYLPTLMVELGAIVRFQPTLYAFLHNGLLLPLHALVILGLALGGGTLCSFLSLRPLVLLGNASYSIYLFHGVMADWIALIAKRLLYTEVTGPTVTAIYVTVLVGFSTAVFRLVEEPARRSLKKRFACWASGSRHESGGVVAGTR